MRVDMKKIDNFLHSDGKLLQAWSHNVVDYGLIAYSVLIVLKYSLGY